MADDTADPPAHPRQRAGPAPQPLRIGAAADLLRVPAAAAAAPSHAGAGNRNGAATGTAPKPAPPPGVFPMLDERHTQLISGIDQTASVAKLNEWLRWGERFPFSAQQRSEHATRRLAALERIALATAPDAHRRPVPARA